MRVLIIDDSRDATLILEKLLGVKGHDVVTARTGIEALKLASVFEPEAILLDIWMPDMDGYEIAKRMRQIEGLESVRIVAYSGANPDPNRDVAAGIDCRLLKPASLQQILEAMGCG
jgi:two-component system CheB/CheR fusion protein